MKWLLCWLLIPLVHANPLEVIQEHLLYPKIIPYHVPLPPKTNAHKQLLQSLKKQKWITRTASHWQSTAKGASFIHIHRSYPSYRITGLRINLCQQTPVIQRKKKKKNQIVLKGHVKIINTFPGLTHIKKHIDHTRLKQCLKQAKTWRIVKKAKRTHVHEE